MMASHRALFLKLELEWTLLLLGALAVIEYPYFEAVIEVPWRAEGASCYWDSPPLWNFADLPPFSRLRLSKDTTAAEIGLIIAELISYNNLESKGNLADRLQEIIDYEDGDHIMGLAGGLRLCGVNPGCCCGLEEWREWVIFLETGQSPWTGHDSDSIVAEIVADRIVCFSDGYSMDFDKHHFASALIDVQKDLVDFLDRLEFWARDLEFDKADRLAAAFDRHFKISGSVQLELPEG
jgi:hypothetical protein